MCMSIRQTRNRYPQNELNPNAIRSLWILWAMVVFNCFQMKAFAWGFVAHRKVIDLSIQFLPSSVHSFYKVHRDWLVEHALDADLRKHSVQGESERHYIDVDLYLDEMPWEELKSVSWIQAKENWSDTTLRHRGIGPWQVSLTYHQLIRAFEDQDHSAILRKSVDLAHYVSDLHVPLHTTSNYDGQRTEQHGIHAFWESQLPEYLMNQGLALSAFHQIVPENQFIPNVHFWIWEIIEEAHASLDELFRSELEVRELLEPNEIFAYIDRGRTRQKMRSPLFVEQYLQRIDHQVESRMFDSAHAVASIWYSAWVHAGQPDLIHPKQNRSIFRSCIEWIIR